MTVCVLDMQVEKSEVGELTDLYVRERGREGDEDEEGVGERDVETLTEGDKKMVYLACGPDYIGGIRSSR